MPLYTNVFSDLVEVEVKNEEFSEKTQIDEIWLQGQVLEGRMNSEEEEVTSAAESTVDHGKVCLVRE